MNPPVQKFFQFPEVKVVEASAGSGKTYALSKRYVQLLVYMALKNNSLPIRNILAITFTNKSAFEMKERILELLKRMVFNDFPKEKYDDIILPLCDDSSKITALSNKIMEELIHNYNFFQVETIDKFINSLLCGCAFKIGLTANFRIKTNAQEYLQYSLDQLVDQAKFNPDIMDAFKIFLRNYLYIENRSGWFPKDDILAIIEILFNQHNIYGIPFRKTDIQADEIIKIKKMILQEMKLLKEVIPAGLNAKFLKKLETLTADNLKGFDIDSISGYFLKEEPPVNKGNNITDEALQIWSLIRLNLRKICEGEAYSLFNPYLSIFSEVMKYFYEVSSKDDVIFLSELNNKARKLFDEDSITVEEIYYRLATRFNHYLIDEFQDTSALQWNNLKLMAEEALSTGGSLFYVGDKKQAIYSFRGGDTYLFNNIKDNFREFNVNTEYLTQNYRSHKTIVEFINEIFSLRNLNRFISQKEEIESKKKDNPVIFTQKDRKNIEDIFKDSRQDYVSANDKGYVRIEYVDIEKKEQRNNVIREKLISLLKDLRTRFSFSDIAIITRSNNEIECLTKWLLEEGITADSERTTDIKENLLIKELISFLKFLNSPIDNLSFASFILGDCFSKAAKIQNALMQNFIFDLREKIHKEKNMYLYTEFRSKYKDIWDNFIDEFFRNVGLYPLYELVISIYNKFKVIENFQEDQGFFMHFLELIKDQEEEYSDISSFIEYFENLKGDDSYVRLSEKNAVKIITVHKSKGLEFSVVILPFFGMEVQVGSTGENNNLSYVLQKSEDHIKLLRLKTKYLGFSDKLYEIYRNEYKKAFISELNNVYVALTRPKNELYAFIPKKVGSNSNILKYLIPEDTLEKGEKSYYENELKRPEGVKLPGSIYKNWIEFLKEEFLHQDEIKNRKNLKKGEIIHFMLSFIKNLKEGIDESLMSRVKEETIIQFPGLPDIETYTDELKNICGNEKLKRFFNFKDAAIFNEKEIVNFFGDTKRIDRLIVFKDEAWVIDYKMSREKDNKYHKQVKEYVQIIESLYKEKKVKGFLIYTTEMDFEAVE